MALLMMTTSLTRVSMRVNRVCRKLAQALAFDRMMRAMFPWAAPFQFPWAAPSSGAFPEAFPGAFGFAGAAPWFNGAAQGNWNGAEAYRLSAPTPEYWWAPYSASVASAFAAFSSFWGAPAFAGAFPGAFPPAFPGAAGVFFSAAALAAPFMTLFAGLTQAGGLGENIDAFWDIMLFE